MDEYLPAVLPNLNKLLASLTRTDIKEKQGRGLGGGAWLRATNTGSIQAAFFCALLLSVARTSVEAQGLVPSGPSAWYDVSGFDVANQTWMAAASMNGGGAPVRVPVVGTPVTIATDLPLDNSTAAPVSYLVGDRTAGFVFPEAYGMPTSGFSVCTVSRYKEPTLQQRIFQSTAGNWLHGHYMGYSGVAFYENCWPAGSFAVPVPNLTSSTSWLILCTAMAGGASPGNIRAYANGYQRTSSQCLVGVGPERIAINTPAASYPAETSAFAVAALLTWTRALSDAELYAVSLYLGQQFAIPIAAQPPPVPVPPPPVPPPPALEARRQYSYCVRAEHRSHFWHRQHRHTGGASAEHHRVSELCNERRPRGLVGL